MILGPLLACALVAQQPQPPQPPTLPYETICPPFTAGGERPGNPPGHALFGPPGVDVWKQDLLSFLAEVLR